MAKKILRYTPVGAAIGLASSIIKGKKAADPVEAAPVAPVTAAPTTESATGGATWKPVTNALSADEARKRKLKAAAVNIGTSVLGGASDLSGKLGG